MEGDAHVHVRRDEDRIVDVGEALVEGLLGAERKCLDGCLHEPVRPNDFDGASERFSGDERASREPDLLRDAVGEDVEDLGPLPGPGDELLHVEVSRA